MKKITFNIEGMHCAACARAAQNSISKLDGVSEAQVNISDNIATVSFDESKVGEKEIFGAVKTAGFEPKEKKNKGLFAKFRK